MPHKQKLKEVKKKKLLNRLQIEGLFLITHDAYVAATALTPHGIIVIFISADSGGWRPRRRRTAAPAADDVAGRRRRWLRNFRPMMPMMAIPDGIERRPPTGAKMRVAGLLLLLLLLSLMTIRFLDWLLLLLPARRRLMQEAHPLMTSPLGSSVRKPNLTVREIHLV